MPRARRQANTNPTETKTQQYTKTSVIKSILSQSTKTAYAASIARYISFTKATNVIPFPGTITTIQLFIVKLANDGYAPSTITSTLPAISYVHKFAALPDPTHAFALRKYLIALEN